MTRRRRLATALAGVALVGGVGWWWLRDRGSAAGGDRAAPAGRDPRGAGRLARHTTPGAPRWLGQPGVGLRRVAGRVTFAGTPVAGATVRLELGGLVRRAMPATTVTSSADGTFDLGPQVAAPVRVSATAPGRAPGNVAIDLRDPILAPAPDRLELVLGDCARTVFGTVHDHGGPIPGATVRALTSRDSLAVGLTGDDGNYELCLGTGWARMTVEADGYARVELDLGGGKRERRDVELSPEAILAGKVLGSGDVPVAGALVTARSSEFGPFMVTDAIATSDGEGRFTIAGVPPGRYSLSARDVGLATGEEVEAVAQVGEPGEEVVLRLEAAALVHGRVLEGDRPVAGARITHRSPGVMPTWSADAGAVTQIDGRFVLDGVLPGPFQIAVAEYELLEPEAPVAALPETELTVKVAGKARVSGRVTREGKPVAGARVNVGGRSARFGGSDLTGADGTYDIGGLGPGTYEIGAEAETAFARKAPITVAKGQHLAGVHIELDLAGEIAGVVVDQRGDPVGGVAVTFEMGPGVDWGHAVAEKDGTFLAGAMSGGGAYAVTVRPSSSSPLLFPPAAGDTFPEIPLADGRSRATGIRIAIQVDRKPIRGMVAGGDGEPAADVSVAAFPPMQESYMMGFSTPAAVARTGADGTFVLGDLLAGDYTVRASTGSGLEAIAEKVPAGKMNLRLALPAAGTINGVLVGFSPKARVTANPVKSHASFSGRLDGQRFSLRGIPPGPYLVSARDGARSDEKMVEVVAGKTVTVELTSEGTATVSGRAIDLVTRAPLARLECGATGSWAGRDGSVTSDGDGRFQVEVPARKKARVACFSRNESIRGGGFAEVELEPGARTDLVVEVVIQRRSEGIFGDVGFHLAAGEPPTVEQVVPGGPGERAGVRAGDAVLKVDGFAVASLRRNAVFLLMLDHKVGEKVELVLGRDGREIAVAVEVVESAR